MLLQARTLISEAFRKSLHHRCYESICVFDCPAWLVDETRLYLDQLRSELPLRLETRDDSELQPLDARLPTRTFTSLALRLLGAVLRQSAVVSSSLVLSSSIMPPLSFPQSLVSAPVLQIENGSESSPFLDLPCSLGLFQAAAQSHAQSGSSRPL